MIVGDIRAVKKKVAKSFCLVLSTVVAAEAERRQPRREEKNFFFLLSLFGCFKIISLLYQSPRRVHKPTANHGNSQETIKSVVVVSPT